MGTANEWMEEARAVCKEFPLPETPCADAYLAVVQDRAEAFSSKLASLLSRQQSNLAVMELTGKWREEAMDAMETRHLTQLEKIAELFQENDRLRMEFEDSQASGECLAERIKEEEEFVAELRAENAKLDERLSSRISRIDEIEEKFADEVLRSAGKDEEIDRLKGEIAEQARANDILSREHERLRDEIRSLKVLRKYKDDSI
jgi:FtsZ-binding cell division protein ZapB